MTRFTVRGLALGALTGLVLALTPAASAFATSPTTAPAPTVTATPSTDLADGQTISVTGAGYPVGDTADLVECAEIFGCDFSNLQVLSIDETGGYTTNFVVKRILDLDGVQVDCVTDQSCILVSLDITDLSTGAQTGITFDPNIPPLPTPNFRIDVDPQGRVRVDKGVARITATVRCNMPLIIDAQVELMQVYKDHIFTSDIFPEFACSKDTTTRVAFVFRPVNGLFGAGTAKVKIDAFTSDGVHFVEKLKNPTVTLVPSAK
jgi:Neocarzinostatin family